MHDTQLASDRATALALIGPVSRETENALALYLDRLRDWQRIKNLVGPATLAEPWVRHIADSAQLLPLASHALRWADLGSGAGFPGLVIAILLAGRAGAEVHLIESNARKCAFLREVARLTGAPARVHAGRIEDVLPELAPALDVVCSRALASPAQLVALTRLALDCGATGLFLTGKGSDDSAAERPGAGPLLERIASRTQAGATILRVTAPRRGAGAPDGASS